MRTYETIVLMVWTVCLLWISVSHSHAQMNRADRLYAAWIASEPEIEEITIEGNVHFSDDKIRSVLYARKSSFFNFLRGGARHRVQRYTVYRDTIEIKYVYSRAGYLGIDVSERIEPVGVDSNAHMYISIDEGNQYIIAGLTLEANDSLPFYPRLLERTENLDAGDPVDPVAIGNISFDLKTVFANNGYPYASIQIDVDSSAGASSTLITFRAYEGPLTRFGDLHISGLDRYRPFIVRREIVFENGDIYRRKEIIRSQKRLYSTGLFNTITLEAKNVSFDDYGPAQLDTMPAFTFSARERPPHFITLKTGAGQDPQQDLIWDLSTSWGKRNLFGSRQIEVLLQTRYIIFTQWRPLNHRFQASYTEPWVFNIRLPLTLAGFFEPGVKSQIQPSKIQRWGFSLTTRKEWEETLFASISAEYENVNVYGVAEEEAQAIRDTIRVRRKLTVNVLRDTRINKFFPKMGSYTTYFAQLVGGPLGGDDSFFKLEWSWARYQQLIGPTIYATRLKAGWVKEFGQSSLVPTDDRFFIGGANTIRGFEENTIGPRSEDGVNVGANAYAIFNQELRFPLFWRFWGSLFTDMGNGLESFSQFDFSRMLFSYGAGVQIVTPAGPIRIDYAHRIENGIYVEDDRFHFTILYAF